MIFRVEEGKLDLPQIRSRRQSLFDASAPPLQRARCGPSNVPRQLKDWHPDKTFGIFSYSNMLKKSRRRAGGEYEITRMNRAIQPKRSAGRGATRAIFNNNHSGAPSRRRTLPYLLKELTSAYAFAVEALQWSGEGT